MSAMSTGRRNGAMGSSAARGVGLVGAAVVLGIILLQVIDDGPSVNGNAVDPSVTTATTAPTDGTTATTAAANARPRDQVRVVVLNGSGQDNVATLKSNALIGLGYQVNPADDTQLRQGSIVACQAGFEAEATRLATDAGPPELQVEAFPATPPAGAENVNCIVILGEA